LNDNKILFDNNLYFAFPKVYKTNVLVIGKSNKQFSKIYTKDEFEYTSTTLNQLDYSIINQQQLIIFNALEYFPNALIETLKYFAKNHGNLVIIPSSESDISTYNNLFTSLQIGEIRASEKTQKSITSINYNHPFFKNVFKKQIINFQYPTVSQIYDTYFPFGSSILQFEDQKDFISEIKYQNNKIYWIASPLNDQISNFFSSPLVVPVFYNFSLIDYDEKKLYFTIGYKNKIIIKSNSNENEVIHLTNNDLDFIPLQVKSTNHITITTNEDPLIDGLYQLKNDSNIFQKIAYNYDREESNLNYYPVDELVSKSQNAQYFTSVNNAVKKLNEQNKNKNLWQLFIIFALMFLGIEIILQKFLKI
jgi:hypothetical protein